MTNRKNQDTNYKFLIPEIIPSLNKGEAAIFKGIVKTLRESISPNIKVWLYSMYPEIDGPRYEEENIEIITGDTLITSPLYVRSKVVLAYKHIWATLKHLIFLMFYKIAGPRILRFVKSPLWKTYGEADIIIVGHDGSFSYFHLTLILFCKALGKPIIIFGASMLPWIDSNALIRGLVKFCLNRVDLITLREELSKKLLDNTKVDNPNIHVTADKAFLLDPASPEVVDKIMLKERITKDPKGILVGVTVAYGSRVYKEAFSSANDSKEKRDKHSMVIAKTIDYLVDNYKATVVLVAHTIGVGDRYDDRIAATDVYKKIGNKKSVILMENEYRAEELKGLIGRCDLFIGERTHSVIAATSMGVPSLMITYPNDYRTHGIIGRMFNQEKWIYNCKDMRLDTLIGHVNELFAYKENVREYLLHKAPEMKKRAMLNGELVRQLLEKINAKNNKFPK